MVVAFPSAPIPWNDGITNQPSPAFLAYMTDLQARVVAAEAAIVTNNATIGAVFLSSQTVTSPVAAIDFTGLIAGYESYVFQGTNLRPTINGNAIAARSSSDNGASFFAGANYASTSIYSYSTNVGAGGGIVSTNNAAGSDTMVLVTHGHDVPNPLGYLNFTMYFYGASDGSVFPLFDINSMSWHSTNGLMWIKTAGLCNGGGGNAIRFLPHSSGAIATGTISLYGMRKT